LNFAEARHLSDQQERFTSINLLQESAKVSDPQSINRYSYSVNKLQNLDLSL